MNSYVSKVNSAIRRYGIKGFLQYLYYRHIRANRGIGRYILLRKARDVNPQPDGCIPKGLLCCSAQSIAEAEDLGASDLWELFSREESSRLFAENAVLFLGKIENFTVCCLWLKESEYITEWYCQLSHHDVVLFALNTRNGFRGKGHMSQLVNYVLALEKYTDKNFYADCAVWNKASINLFLKHGFRNILLTTKEIGH